MARTSIKSTYSLDVETVRKLERVAARWRVSKSEVLRRAIDAVASDRRPNELTPLQALDELQKSLKLGKRELEQWQAAARRERQSFGRRQWRSR
jgi:Arc/MetJ-type ribon-helix-helix transcriptional regulator